MSPVRCGYRRRWYGKIVHKTDGIPFFAEELTRAIIEIGILDSVEDARAPEIVPALAIAATLHGR